MKYYKHYSFDLWGTLIVSNPEFKKNRALFLYSNYNTNQLTLEQVSDEITFVDRMVNQTNEMIGYNIDAHEMFAMVLSRLNTPESFKLLKRQDIIRIYDQCIAIFHQHLPVFTNSDMLLELEMYKRERIKENGLVSFSILSNTGFIKGSEMRYVLKILGIAWLMDFEIYSDEVGYSKPNRNIFETLYSKASNIHTDINLQREDIIHIGDSLEADKNGATRSGFDNLFLEHFKNFKLTRALHIADDMKMRNR